MHRSLRGVWLRKDHRDPDRQRAGGRVLRGQPDGGDPCSKQGHRRPGGLGALVFDGQRFPESPHPVLQPRHDRRDCVWHGEPRRSQEGDAQARARRRARARHRVPDGQRHLRALRGPDAIGGLRERMGLQAERLRPRRAFEQSGPSLHGEARLLHLESQVERVCRDHRRAQALLPRERRRPVLALRRRFRRRRMGRAAIPGAVRRGARVLRAQILRAAEARRPDAAPFPSRLRLSRRRGEGNLCGVREGCAGPRGDYRLVRPREGRRRGRAKRGRQVNPAQVPGGGSRKKSSGMSGSKAR